MSSSENWEELLLRVSKKFKVLADFDFVLFLIGIQERGLGYKKYSKEEKMDLINLARCKMFEKAGFYTEAGKDEEGWPRFEVVKTLEDMLPSEREKVLKQEMINYLDENI
ncbi:hypothetical protein [Plebeiibacterium marinum]|uniref:Uncharacterized protein n=1 Tax=Plebeiibacterium marinum TaxID=2992111 RepID=A0AAE3MCL5_9BACT|nr:hypothetical protein [Plebeiobacterium marinum]MCW3805092.1 hypothetical protein [Plebeiobacterium marinum]